MMGVAAHRGPCPVSCTPEAPRECWVDPATEFSRVMAVMVKWRGSRRVPIAPTASFWFRRSWRSWSVSLRGHANRLPELYAGLHRDVTSFPVQYLGANVPQAWAAGSVFSLLHTMLGLQPDAPQAILYVDPALPSWLNDLTIRNLRIDEQVFDIRFWRTEEETRFEVLKGDPARVARRELTAWSNLLKGSGDVSAPEGSSTPPSG